MGDNTLALDIIRNLKRTFEKLLSKGVKIPQDSKLTDYMEAARTTDKLINLIDTLELAEKMMAETDFFSYTLPKKEEIHNIFTN